MLKHVNKLLVLLCTFSLIGCWGDRPAQQIEFADGSDRECTILSKDQGTIPCSMKIKFNKLNQSGLKLDYKIYPYSDVDRKSCENKHRAGCGIAYDNEKLELSIKSCQGTFASQDTGFCEILFEYTPGKSGGESIIKSMVSIKISGGNDTGDSVSYNVSELLVPK